MPELRQILRDAGFSGQGLDTAYAVAMAESGGNPRAFNGDRGTGDQSYGLFQINMLGGMGPERRRFYGLQSNDDLFDPVRNAEVAYRMSKGGTYWRPWSTFKNGTYRKFMGGGPDAPSVTLEPAVPEPSPPQRPTGSWIDSPDDSFVSADGGVFDDDDPRSYIPDDPGDTSLPLAALWEPSNSTNFRDQVIGYAMQQLGVPYSWGGGGRAGKSRGIQRGRGTVGFDCSGLMQYVFGRAGVNLPRIARQQLATGQRTSIQNLRPGDLVGFRDGGHVGLYIGNNQIIEAPRTGLNVRVRTLSAKALREGYGVRLNLPGD